MMPNLDSSQRRCQNKAGRDLTESLLEAPHDAIVLTQFPIVGTLEGD
jgi:predicted heme/steroid binding protein